MSGQCTSTATGLITYITSEPLFPCVTFERSNFRLRVESQVPCKIMLEGECLVAYFTSIRSLPRVSPLVSDHSVSFNERPATYVTLVRVFAGVDSKVVGQCTGLGKTFVADHTLVWPVR